MSDNFFKIAKGVTLKSQTAIPANPQNGDMYYNSTLNKFRKYENGSWGDFGGASSGALNLLTNGDAESASTTGWLLDSVAAAARPSGSLNGTSAGITFSTTTINPLNGINSFTFAKDAANRRGQLVRNNFLVPLEFRAKVLSVRVPYIVNAGTFVAGTNTTDSDAIVYIREYNGSVYTWKEPSSFKFLSNSSTISDVLQAEFQTNHDTISCDFVIYCASVSALAYTLKLDDITVSPSTYVYGTPITDWVSYTPVLTTSGGGSITLNATGSTGPIGRWRRVGDSVEIIAAFRNGSGGAATGTAGTVRIGIPTGLTIADSTKIINDGVVGHNVGIVGHYTGAATNNLYAIVDALTTYVSSVKTTVEYVQVSDLAANVGLDMNVSIPILGWSSSVQMSDQTDTRVVAMYATGTTQSIPNTTETTIKWATRIFDTHSAYNTITGLFTCPVAGKYRVTAILELAGNSTGSRDMRVRKNGVSYSILDRSDNLPATIFWLNGSAIVDCKSGDTLEASLYQSSGGALNVNSNGGQLTNFSIERISGPSAIAASESVNARYVATSGQSLVSGNNTIQFPTQSYDSHGLFTSNTTFTAQIPGKYSFFATFAMTPIASSSTCAVLIQKGGVTVTRKPYVGSFVALETSFEIQDTLQLLAGETITFVFTNGFGGTVTMISTANTNFFNVIREGN